ncbi:hypothetical protein NFI96_005534 [Prochilodus magdalenae]|nr:hypothetical protein NFI96_005534 [Prochilodus magdalenae]
METKSGPGPSQYPTTYPTGVQIDNHSAPARLSWSDSEWQRVIFSESPALVLVETPNESVCGGTVVSTKMNVHPFVHSPVSPSLTPTTAVTHQPEEDTFGVSIAVGLAGFACVLLLIMFVLINKYGRRSKFGMKAVVCQSLDPFFGSVQPTRSAPPPLGFVSEVAAQDGC